MTVLVYFHPSLCNLMSVFAGDKKYISNILKIGVLIQLLNNINYMHDFLEGHFCYIF